jgi:hypothetical protein
MKHQYSLLEFVGDKFVTWLYPNPVIHQILYVMLRRSCSLALSTGARGNGSLSLTVLGDQNRTQP